MSSFGARLKALRNQAGVTQVKLAEMTGLHRQAIAKLELGAHEPSWGTVLALAKALGVRCDSFILEGEEGGEVKPAAARAPKKAAGAGAAERKKPVRKKGKE